VRGEAERYRLAGVVRNDASHTSDTALPVRADS
jgi:hypothetical protein